MDVDDRLCIIRCHTPSGWWRAIGSEVLWGCDGIPSVLPRSIAEEKAAEWRRKFPESTYQVIESLA